MKGRGGGAVAVKALRKTTNACFAHLQEVKANMEIKPQIFDPMRKMDGVNKKSLLFAFCLKLSE